MSGSNDEQQQARRFADEAGRKRRGAVGELADFLRHNKKWWLTPIIIIMLLVVGALVILGGTAAAPFIYTLF